MKRAQKLLKNSKKRDYYKILGVKRNARKPEIMRAYRKLAIQFHPDKFEESQKAKAQEKFMDIAAAKEVWICSSKYSIPLNTLLPLTLITQHPLTF